MPPSSAQISTSRKLPGADDEPPGATPTKHPAKRRLVAQPVEPAAAAPSAAAVQPSAGPGSALQRIAPQQAPKAVQTVDLTGGPSSAAAQPVKQQTRITPRPVSAGQGQPLKTASSLQAQPAGIAPQPSAEPRPALQPGAMPSLPASQCIGCLASSMVLRSMAHNATACFMSPPECKLWHVLQAAWCSEHSLDSLPQLGLPPQACWVSLRWQQQQGRRPHGQSRTEAVMASSLLYACLVSSWACSGTRRS